MIAKYQIFKELNLEVLKFDGSWNSDDFKKYLKKISLDDDRRYVERILIDLRKVRLNVAINDLDYIIKLREEYIDKEYTVIHLVDNPAGTVLSHLYQERLKEKELKYSYCSTIEYAINFLKLNYTNSEMENLIENINNQAE